jgi:ribonuclease HI
MNNEIIIFTDGSSSGNPGPGGWGAIVSLPSGNIIELGGREQHTTNNRMELKAALEALRNIKTIPGDVVINTDSSYLIQGITVWVKGWQRNNWITSTKTDVVNKDLWQDLIDVVKVREEVGKITWKHIAGHSGVPGNERVDEIATAYTFKKDVELFNGKKEDYTVDVFSVTPNRVKKEIKDDKRARSKQKAFSYVSFVEGKIERHTTWAECEARIKGKKGVKFKKSLSQEDENNIVKEWMPS